MYVLWSDIRSLFAIVSLVTGVQGHVDVVVFVHMCAVLKKMEEKLKATIRDIGGTIRRLPPKIMPRLTLDRTEVVNVVSCSAKHVSMDKAGSPGVGTWGHGSRTLSFP